MKYRSPPRSSRVLSFALAALLSLVLGGQMLSGMAHAQVVLEQPVAEAGQSAASNSFNPEQAAQDSLVNGRHPWYGPNGLQRLTPAKRPDLPTSEVRATASALSEILGWLFLVAALVALGVAIYFIIKHWAGFAKSNVTVAKREASRTVDRVEELPVGVASAGPLDFLAEAQQAAAAGDFGKAVVYLYGWQLLQLDRAHLVRLVKGKTNGQYVRETTQNGGAELAASLRLTVEAFESVYFGGRPLSRELFEPLWRRIPEFQRLAAPRVA